MITLLLALCLAAEPGAVSSAADSPPDTLVPSEPVPLSQERLAAIRLYRRQHLRLLPELTLRFAPPPPMGPFDDPYAWAPPKAPTEHRSLVVYQGSEQVKAPMVFDLIGRNDLATRVEEKIQSNRRVGTTLYTVGGVGLLTAVGGFIAMERGRDSGSGRLGGTMALAGLGAVGVGFIGGTFPLTRARHLEADPSAVLPVAEIEEELDVFNEALRLELGLRPADVVLFERAREPVLRVQ